MPKEYWLEVFKAALSLIVAGSSFVATWYVGNGLTATWNLRQKRRELNLESVHALHELYGEFKEVVKIWRLAKRSLKAPVAVPADERWKLLMRACAIESKTEALVLRLATERRLQGDEPEAIGMFRQAIQTLRESIRDDIDCPLGSRGKGYELLNQLAPRVAAVVIGDLPAKPPSTPAAQAQLAAIVGVTRKAWAAKVESMKAAASGSGASAVEAEDA